MPDEPKAPGYRILTSQLQGRTTEMEQHEIPSQQDDVIAQQEQDSDRKRPRKMFRVGILHGHPARATRLPKSSQGSPTSDGPSKSFAG